MSRIEKWVALVAVGVALAVAGCGDQPSQPSAAAGPAKTIEAMVPCGQIGPFYEALKLFEAANPGVQVHSVPENMVTITAQIVDGKAQPDLFLTMGDLEMDQVEQAGLVAEGTRTKYAENSLAIMTPDTNPAGVHAIADLTKAAVKGIAVPDPETNSVGMHAVAALKAAGIWDQVEGKIFVMRMAADTKDAAAQGQVQATIGYYPCAVEVHIPGQPPTEAKKLKMVGPIASDLYRPFWCEGAVVEGSNNPEGGRKLLEFLTTPEAQEIFRKWQFVSEPPAAES